MIGEKSFFLGARPILAGRQVDLIDRLTGVPSGGFDTTDAVLMELNISLLKKYTK